MVSFKGYQFKLVLLPFFSHSTLFDDNQLYMQIEEPEMNGHYYIPFKTFYGLVADFAKKEEWQKREIIQKILNHSRCFWLSSYNYFYNYQAQETKRISFNPEVPFFLDYTAENCQKLQQLNAVFRASGKSSPPLTGFHPELIKDITRLFNK